jgi:hypothetical protein
MKSCIPKIAISLVLAVPASYSAVHVVRTVNTSDAIDTVLFHADLPNRFSAVMTDLKMLPERITPTRSDCN